MGNTTRRVDLNTFGRTNEFAHILLIEYTHSVVRNNRTKQHYAKLPGSTASCGKCTDLYIRITCCLTCQTNPIHIEETPRWPFPLYVEKYVRAGSISKHGYMYCQLYNYMHGHVCAQPTLNEVFSTFSLLSTSLMDELLQTLSNNLPYCKQQKTRRGLGTRLVTPQ